MTSNTQIIITQYQNLSSSKFEELVSDNKPFIVKGAVTSWKAFKDWSPDYFKKTYPNKKVDMQVTYCEQSGKFRFDTKRLTMVEAISHICNNDNPNVKYYLAHQSITNDFVELQQDVDKFEFDNTDKKYDINFWFGEGGNKTPLHFDYPQNLHAQIRGRKYIQLYNPIQNSCLYPPIYEKGRERYHVSQVINPDEPDLEKFPRFKEAVPHVNTLEPGDVIYIPSGWWHFIQSTELSISANLWWKPYYRECNMSHILRHVANIMFNKGEFNRIWDIFDQNNNITKLEVAEYLAYKGELWLSAIFAADFIREKLDDLPKESIIHNPQRLDINTLKTKILSMNNAHKVKEEDISQWHLIINEAKLEQNELIDINQLNVMISVLKHWA